MRMKASLGAAMLTVLLIVASTVNAQGDAGACACTMEWNPQCDPVTNITYGSPSCAKCAGSEVAARIQPGGCPDKEPPSCACTREFNPQCDKSTNTTYSNPCTAKCAGAQVTEGACPDEKMTDPSGSCICFELYDPVCGSDGQTYANSCFAACAGLTTADTKPGKCEPKSQIAECEAACMKEDEQAICAIFIESNKHSLRKKAKGKQTVKTVSFASPCIAACNDITKAVATYRGPCDEKADKRCAADVCRDHATCVDLGGDAGFVEVPSSCYANKLYSNGTILKDQKAGCIGEAAKSILESSQCLMPSTVRCFADPCSVSSCSVKSAICVSNYCTRLYRGTLLTGLCQAVFLDPATGDIITNCV